MLRARALRTAGETARRDLLPALRGQIRSQDPACGFWTAWSAVLFGDRGEALSALQSIAVSDTPLGSRALQVPRVLPPADAGSRRWRTTRSAGGRLSSAVVLAAILPISPGSFQGLVGREQGAFPRRDPLSPGKAHQ